MDQWVEWITMPDPEYDIPNIDWLIVVFTRTKKGDGNSDPGIKSWEQPVGTLKDLLKIYVN